jgi:hypothetical protein
VEARRLDPEVVRARGRTQRNQQRRFRRVLRREMKRPSFVALLTTTA